jgi:hypothetical protein
MAEDHKREMRDPHKEKELDYKHQRSATEGGDGWRKVRAKLPKMERKLYRHAQEKALRESMRLAEDGELEAGAEVNGLKRKYFRLLLHRREITLGKKVELHLGGVRPLAIWLPAGRKQGRNYLPLRKHVKLWIERDGRQRQHEEDDAVTLPPQ